LRTETLDNIARDNPDGEDLQVRQAAVNAMAGHAGTAVVMEAQTGKIVTIVNQEWAIRNGFKPCSTIKLVTGVAGLSENVIDNEGNINGSNFRVQLQDALAFSNNAYFQRVGSNLGNPKMISYAKTLGLGEPTGINAPGESAGKLPYGNGSARIYSHGDDFEVTPLQLAVLVSAISNGGKRVVPTIAKTKFETTNFRSHYKSQINLPAHDLEGMLPGMIGAADYGTARKGVDHSLGIAGKTGSCIAKGSWVGLFASVAPVENPKYSVVVITRGQGERGKYAAAVAGKIYQALAPRLGQNPDRDVATAPFRVKSSVAARSSAKMADEDDDDGDAADTQSPIVVGQGQREIANAPVIQQQHQVAEAQPEQESPLPKPVNKTLIKRTGNSKAVFAPVVITYKKDADGNFTKVEPVEKTRPRIVKNK
jgi:Cell division protein FtsI/penicillin-binding protein 2